MKKRRGGGGGREGKGEGKGRGGEKKNRRKEEAIRTVCRSPGFGRYNQPVFLDPSPALSLYQGRWHW